LGVRIKKKKKEVCEQKKNHLFENTQLH